MKNDSTKNDAQLAAIVLTCLSLAVGPGLLLVNRPVFFLGIPIVYAWAIFWYLVLCGVAIAARRKTFSSDQKSTDTPE